MVKGKGTSEFDVGHLSIIAYRNYILSIWRKLFSTEHRQTQTVIEDYVLT